MRDRELGGKKNTPGSNRRVTNVKLGPTAKIAGTAVFKKGMPLRCTWKMVRVRVRVLLGAQVWGCPCL